MPNRCFTFMLFDRVRETRWDDWADDRVHRPTDRPGVCERERERALRQIRKRKHLWIIIIQKYKPCKTLWLLFFSHSLILRFNRDKRCVEQPVRAKDVINHSKPPLLLLIGELWPSTFCIGYTHIPQYQACGTYALRVPMHTHRASRIVTRHQWAKWNIGCTGVTKSTITPTSVVVVVSKMGIECIWM